MQKAVGIGVAAMLVVASVAAPAAPQVSSTVVADVIYRNGKIFKGLDEGFAEAVAVRDGRIIAVGADELLLTHRGEATRLVDLDGRTMLPGFFDNHIHLGRDGPRLMEWKGGLIAEVPEWIRDATEITGLQDALRDKAAEMPQGDWILGALSREVWPNQTLPTRWDLDEGAFDHPVLLTRGPHTTILNSRALTLAGISRSTHSAGGGEVGKDATGEPDGRLYDAARRLVEEVAPSRRATVIDQRQAIENMRRSLLQHASGGVTSVNIASVRPDELRTIQTLYERHGEELPRATVQLRLRPGYDAYDDLDLAVREAVQELESIGFVTGFGDDRLRLGTIKMSIDGGLSAPAFWSLGPYENRPEFQGVVRIPATAFYPVARRAHELGWQLGIHGIGDGAAKMVVEQLERILTELPRQDHRHYLHHVSVKPPQATIDAMARLGIGVASQPSFTVGLGAFATEALDGDREATMNPTRSLLDAGVWVSWGSDGAPYGPRVSLWAGITRKGWDDRVYGPAEAVTRSEAVHLHTWAPAYQTFSEDVKGTIEVGKLADFVVLGEDVFTIDVDRIRYVPILRTIVGGREIYARE